MRCTHRCPLLLFVLCVLGAAPAGRAVAAMSEEQLRATLAGALAQPALQGASTSCLVVALEENRTLFSVRSNRARIPASQVKLLVSATAIELFGASFVYAATVWSEAEPEEGVLRGDIYLQGYADPTATEGIYGELARQMRLRGVRVVEGDLVGVGPVLLKERDRGQRAAQRLAEALRAAGVQTRGGTRCASCFAAPVLLARHTTVALQDYLREMNKESVNSRAERLLGSLLACFHNPADPDPRFVLAYWARQGQTVEGLRLVDGSGYSRDNRLSAALLVAALQRCAQTESEYRVLSRSLPVAGADGTLSDRMRGTAAESRVRAKTGTLPGVSCLSGYVESQGRPRLAFSILMNGFSCPLGAARRAQDQMAIALAQYVKEKWG